MPLPFDAIVNRLEDPVLCLDQDGKVAWLNAAAARAFECSPAQATGRAAAQIPSLADVARQLNLAECAAQAGSSPESWLRRSIQWQRARGETVALEASVSQVKTANGSLFTVLLRDVSASQRLEAAVYEARKIQALAALSGGIAHDFNNVLTAVISQIDLALDTPGFPPALRDHLIYAQTSARRGAELVSRLELFSRPSKPEFTALDLLAVIDQAVFMLRRSLDPKITIVTAPAPAAPWLVRADSRQITQALLNLAINARDAMPQGGRLTFQVENVSLSEAEAPPPRKAGEFVRLTVSDTGQGMAPDVAARITEPYFTTKDRSRGQGLGLTITAAVIAEHAGWMEVESRPGAGSRFSLFLPRNSEPVAQPARVEVTDPKTTEGKERVLVVDDEDLVRLVTKAVLSYRGYQVLEAEDGQDAVEKYHAAGGSIDLILMDMHMPRMNGYDALQKLRQMGAQTPAIMLSGGVHDAEAELSELQGVAFLHKPFENQELLRLVRRMLDEQQRLP
jgi:PAS domain S-box-containing protein